MWCRTASSRAARHKRAQIRRPAQRLAGNTCARSLATRSYVAGSEHHRSSSWWAWAGTTGVLVSSALCLWTSNQHKIASASSAEPAPLRTLQDVKPEAYAAIVKLLGERLSIDEDDLRTHGKSSHSYHEAGYPWAVARVHTTDEVSAIVRIAATHNIPIVSYGSGTSLEGHTAAYSQGITVNMQDMDKVIAVHEGDMDVVVQPGV